MPNQNSSYGYERSSNSSHYGKRPLWQWIVLYLVIGGAIYFAIYYFFLRNNYKYPNYTGSGYQNSQTPSYP